MVLVLFVEIAERRADHTVRRSRGGIRSWYKLQRASCKKKLFTHPVFAPFSNVYFKASPANLAIAFAAASLRSLYRLPNSSVCGRIMMVYLTNSSMTSTKRSRFPLGRSRAWPLPSPPSSSNCLYAVGMLDWFGTVNMRIQRPRTRRLLTVLNDWLPPFTWTIPRTARAVSRASPCCALAVSKCGSNT